MIPDIRIKYNGVNVRLVGFGFKKLQNLKILETGIASIKERLAKGISENDSATQPLKKRYARFKSKKTGRRAIRDLKLTGQLLDSIKPRYADDNQAIADAGTRLGRMKARMYRDLLLFSERDQAAMRDRASVYFREGVEQVVSLGRSPGRSAAASRATLSNRRTYFGRSQ